MHDNIRNNTSRRAVASTTQTEVLAPVIFFLLFSPFHEVGKEKKAGVLTIYTGKPEIPVGKSNGSHHSVWEAS